MMIWSLKNGIVPMPTTSRQKRCMLQSLPENSSGIIYDLGSGWGGLALSAGSHFPNSKVIGIESSPVPYWFSKAAKTLLHSKNVEFQRADIFSRNYSDASAIICYLHRDAVRKLAEQLPSQLKPGTYVISNTFLLPGWKPIEVLETGDLNRTKVYVYRV